MAFGLAAIGLWPAVATAATQEAGRRDSISLVQGWLFRFGDAPNARTAVIDNSGWSPVSVPHTWNRLGYYVANGENQVNGPANANNDQGIGWYRLAFAAPAHSEGRRVWLQFDAASRTAEVWLNGIRLGEHRGGFTRFRFDATAALRRDDPNLLVVRTDNSQPAEGSSTADVLPLSGDFFVHGGLYRPVSLILTDPVHIDMLDHGGPGVYAATTSIDGGNASVEVRTRIRNDGGHDADLRLSARLVNAAGRAVATSVDSVRLGPGGGSERRLALRVANARLWQGTQDPYLYTLRVEIRSASGRLLDRLDQPFGIRRMRFDAESGFFLNERPLRLRGVGLHQDREGRGWAISSADVAEDIAIIRDMGANAIRLTHYPHGQAIHELADRYGLILWDEIPLVNAWTEGQRREATPALVTNARQQLQEMIRQNQNHASVAVWGIANEVDFGTGRPGFFGGPTASAPDPMPLLQMLGALAHSEDPSRPTALANCCEGGVIPNARDVPAAGEATDVVAANRYFGWYYGQPSQFGPHLDRLRAARPAQPLAVSEYGAGGALSIHTDDPSGGPVDVGGAAQPEEYQSWFHEENWRVLQERSYLWATWAWTAFDYATPLRREGDSVDINTKGLVSYDRRSRKDAFYFYRANWSAAPTVHITGRRYVDRAYPVTNVRVYSNAPRTELTVNGRSLGARTNCPQRVCVWPSLRLEGGANRIVALGRFASAAVEDAIDWRVSPDALHNMRIDSGALVAARPVRARFGSDAFFEGGSPGTLNRPGGWGRPPVVVPIAGTSDQSLLATYREGVFRYRVPLEVGRYNIVLTFVEPAAAAGENVFTVLANGEPVLPSFDVAAVAGSPLTAVQRSFTATVSDGELLLDFRPTTGRAIVSAVEILREPGSVRRQ